jgi:tetratricopeptide (TPR) repeat protein
LQSSTELVDESGAELTAGTGSQEDVSPLQAAEILMEEHDYEAAAERLLALLQTSDRDGETCILLSKAFLKLEDVEQTLDYALKAVELLPESGAAHHAHARALGLKMMKGNKLAAMMVLPQWKKALFQAVELDPSLIDARAEQIFFYIVTPGLLGGDLDKGLELSLELEKLDPVRGKLMSSLAHFQKDEVDQAVELCRAGATEFPEKAGEFHVTVAGFHARKEKFEEADLAFEAARAGARDEPYYRALHGQAKMRIDASFEQQQAVTLLDEYISAAPRGDLLPRLPQVWTEKGNALQQLEKIEEARTAYQEALRIDEDYAAASDALSALGN